MNLKEYIKMSKNCNAIDHKTITVLYQLHEFDSATKLDLLYWLQRTNICLKAKYSMGLTYWKIAIRWYKSNVIKNN